MEAGSRLQHVRGQQRADAGMAGGREVGGTVPGTGCFRTEVGRIRLFEQEDVKRNRYRTGLLSAEDDYSPPPPYYGRGWRATWEKQGRKFPRTSGKEVVLYAADWQRAQGGLNLILACLYLTHGNPPLFDQVLIARGPDQPALQFPEERKARREQYLSMCDISLACATAAKASTNSRYAYAIFKYYFSIKLYSVFSVDLEPFRSPHLSLSPFADDHVMFSHAIMAAYSAVEDLGLEVRASARNPSRIDGKWNPFVLGDVEKRLHQAKVNTGETILFTLRGPPKKTERERPLPAVQRAPWARGNVRDVELSVADAIAHASWLRSKTAAHRANTMTKSLSPYDVVNVQHLARRLILESLGFWRFHAREARTRQSTVRLRRP